jgi:Zn-dependent protease with chaperone function
MATGLPPLDVRKKRRAILFKSLVVPLLLLGFFIVAPHWLNSRIRTATGRAINASPNLSFAEKQQRRARLATVDFRQVALNCPPGWEKLRDSLQKSGVVGTFRRLQWGLFLSIALVAGLLVAVGCIFLLNGQAAKSPRNLIHCYRLAWHISIVAALANVFLLIPLLAYGTFEFSVLLTDHFYPNLLFVIVLGGLVGLLRSAQVLLKEAPMHFKEPMSREVTPQDAPELWQAVGEAAKRLQTDPPDRIVIGLQLNFYVTELAVIHDSGKAEGRTLFLSYPLLKNLSDDEVLAIIGHELGHFIGADTKLTRDFFPLRFKIQGTVIALARSGWIGWPSFQLLNLFALCFAETERTASRARELLADQQGASLTSPRTTARALVRFQVLVEAFQRGLKDAVMHQAENPLNLSLQPIVRERLAPDADFWKHLFEKNLPHPLDSHPALQVRLAALGQNISATEAEAIALAETTTAYEKWFSQRDALFTGLASQADAAVGKMRSRAQIVEADYQTAGGKKLLEQHFPEKRWRLKASTFWGGLVFLALMMAACLAAAIFVRDAVARIILGVFGILLGVMAARNWTRHRRGELTLNAEGICYSGWKKPVRFRELEKLFARKTRTNIIMIFRLKGKQPSVWRFSVLPFPSKVIGLSLSGFDERPLVMTPTIFRYCARQTAETPIKSDR